VLLEDEDPLALLREGDGGREAAVGGELQLDPQWQARVEASFLGARVTLLAGLTCRMGL
jgi:hypothetical protein